MGRQRFLRDFGPLDDPDSIRYSAAGRFSVHVITDPGTLARIEAGNQLHAERMRDPEYVARMEAAHQRIADRNAREWADALGIDQDADDQRGAK